MDAEMSVPYFQETMNSVETGATMDEDGSDINTSDNESTESDIEWELQHLKKYDNMKQLDILRREIGHIVAHNVLLPEECYNERFVYIHTYSQLGWAHMAKRFHNKDHYIHDTALYIMRLLDELIEERGAKPTFHIPTYHKVIHNIQSVWNYYSRLYMAGEEDANVMDLIEGMMSLGK